MRAFFFAFIAVLLLLSSCANIVPPSGGKKDITPPKLLAISPADSSLNTRPKKIELEFDEYIQLTDPAAQVQLSPLLPVPLTVTATNKRVVVTIPDSLLQEGTTYRLTFGTAIRDLHEGNQYNSKSYTFSTGTFFDSLRIGGMVLSAPTGLPDTAALLMLYSGKESDSAVVRHKPLYVVHADGSGKFSFEGLPARPFRLYAMHDANNNLTYDGGEEWIAFHPEVIIPRADSNQFFLLRTFKENNDTAGSRGTTALNQKGSRQNIPAISGTYAVQADTGDSKRRTQELNKPLSILFTKKPAMFLASKLFLTYDSTGITVEAGYNAKLDSTGLRADIITPWKDNTVYTLRLQKGFAKDSAGADLLPGRYTFRTKRDEDYGTLRIHLPSKYYGAGHVLQVVSETDTVRQQPVLDTMVTLRYLAPARYTIRIIEDNNRNGRWDAGNLFRKLQPEIVIPYDVPILLKAGWDNLIDFERAPATTAPPGNKPGAAINDNRLINKPK